MSVRVAEAGLGSPDATPGFTARLTSESQARQRPLRDTGFSGNPGPRSVAGSGNLTGRGSRRRSGLPLPVSLKPEAGVSWRCDPSPSRAVAFQGPVSVPQAGSASSVHEEQSRGRGVRGGRVTRSPRFAGAEPVARLRRAPRVRGARRGGERGTRPVLWPRVGGERWAHAPTALCTVQRAPAPAPAPSPAPSVPRPGTGRSRRC